MHWFQAGGAERWALETVKLVRDAGFLPIVITVSYTHLDVYKRQSMFVPKSRPVLIFPVEVLQIPPPFSCIPATVPRLNSSLLIGSLMEPTRS